MTRPFVAGPVSEGWPPWFAHHEYTKGLCIFFGLQPFADVQMRPDDNWDSFSARLPSARMPEFVLLNLNRTTMPPWLWKSPLPLIGLADDWSLQWHNYRRILRWCDLVFADATGVELLRRIGVTHARPGRLKQVNATPKCDSPPFEARDIDILFLAEPRNREALRLLPRLGLLARRWSVAIPKNCSANETSKLLQRSKIAIHVNVNDSFVDASDIAESGAVLFQQATAATAPSSERVLFTDQNLEDLVEYYLSNHNAREEVVNIARQLWQGGNNPGDLRVLLRAIEFEWDEISLRAQKRATTESAPDALTRCWHSLASGIDADPHLVSDVISQTQTSSHQNMLGLVLTHSQQGDPTTEANARTAMQYFRRALAINADDVVARLNLVEALMGADLQALAVDEARRALSFLEDHAAPTFDLLDAGHFPPVLDSFWHEWEHAAWSNAGYAVNEVTEKRRLLYWRLHLLLAELTGDLVHYHEAVLSRPDLPNSRAALGCALGRAGRPVEAVRHLKHAVTDDPLDLSAARALFHALGEAGMGNAQLRLAEERLAISRLLPELVPADEWLLYNPAMEPPKIEVDALPGQEKRQQRISLCMIVKNEAENLPECLRSVADMVDDVVIVDTGSTDGTKEIAQRFGARIFDFPWIDDFSAARNESLRHAQGDWIFWLDADDRLDEENRHRLKALFAELPNVNAAYVMKCLCLPDNASGTATVVDHVRLFRNDPHLRWRYRVHEQILLSLRDTNAVVHWSDVIIHHIGYQDAQQRARKLERDLKLLAVQNEERPGDPFTLFNLGWSYHELGRPSDALPYLQRSLEGSNAGDSIVRKLYALIIFCHRQLGQTSEAMTMCQDGLHYCPDDTEILFEYGMLLQQTAKLPAAEACFLQLINQTARAQFSSIDPELRGCRPRHQLALIYEQTGRDRDAEKQWQTILSERSNFRPAIIGLAELYLRQRRWQEFDESLKQLEFLSGGEIEASILRARRFMADGKFDEARTLLDDICARYPKALLPHIVRSHVLLQENKDLDEAERALRAVLTLDPNHEQTKHNLKVLLATRTRTRGPV